MNTRTSPPHRRRLLSKQLLVLGAGIVLLGMVATILQVERQSASADTINGVTVTQHDTEAKIKNGTKSTCEISSTATFTGDPKRVLDFINSASKTARDKGMKVSVGGVREPGPTSTPLTLSYDFDLTAWSITPDSCSTKATVEAHRGRSTLQLPGWARGMVAAAAALAVYLTVVFVVTALFTFLAPEFAIYGELVGGCIGGFAQSYVSNAINRVPQAANLTGSAVQCIAGAVVNVSLGSIKTQMVEKLRSWLGTSGSLSGAASQGISHAAGSPGDVSGALNQGAIELSRSLSAP